VRRVWDEREAERETRLRHPRSTGSTSPADAILALQRSAGNANVSRLIARNTKSGVLARQGAATAAATATRPARDFLERDVDREITETISHAPAAFSQWNGSFSWRSKWRLRLDLRAEIGRLDVIVRLHSNASAAVKRSWENAIVAKWSGKFAFCVKREHPVVIRPGVVDRYEEMYPIHIIIAWVPHARDAHYVIRPNAPGATEGGRAGVGGTTSMVGWGTADTQDITHEFGHMLGCPEEYFTTNGVNFVAGGGQGFRDPSGGVMNNPAGSALARNFELIRKEAAALRGVAATRAEIAPWR
jgi:hypothetical protein